MTSIFIDGKIYDITDFIKIHPGGSVIKYYANSDATAAFNEFHYRSTYARNILETLPVIKTEDSIQYPKNKQLLKDFYILKNKLIISGYFKPSIRHVIYRILEITSLFFVASLLFYFRILNTSIACLIFGIAEGRSGWFMHEAGHYSLCLLYTSPSPRD